jgi:hypothetical protein
MSQPTSPQDAEPMSASRRRTSSDKKRRQADPGDELPELEPVLEPVPDEELESLEPLEDFELETLEPLDEDSPVQVAHRAADEAEFDRRIEVTVPEMAKSEVAGAVEGPLRRLAGAAAAELRFQRVLVHFGGEAMIGSAIKELVAGILAPVRPLSVVVRRGFGDEVVHEGRLPSVELNVQSRGDVLDVAVATGACEVADLPFALRAELAGLAAAAAGKRVAFTFDGALADRATRTAIAAALTGARRLEVDGRLMFDAELEARVRVEADGDAAATLTVEPAAEAATTIAALEMVLPRSADALAGRAVTVRSAGPALREVELAKALELLAPATPSRIAVAGPDGLVDLIWPRLLRTAVRGDQGAIRVEPAGRDRRALIAAFRREAAGLAEVVADKRVTVDWPAGTELDAELERACLGEALGALHPKTLSCTWQGEDREPFVPAPVTFRVEAGDLHLIHVDTEVAKPVELVRAIERRVGAVAPELRGKAARIEIRGSVAASRTMVRRLRELCEGGGALRLELDAQGQVDVLLPALLRIEPDGAGTVLIAAEAGGRDAEQVEAALQRELDAAEIPAGAAFVVEPSPLAETVVAAVVGRGASRVSLGGERPVQVHPALFGTPEQDGASLALVAQPAGDEPVLLAQIERELGPLLDAIGPLAEVDLTLVWPGAGDPQAEPVARTLEAILARGPRRLRLDDGVGRPVQLFPEIVPDYVVELGRKDDAVPPLLMLGIDLVEGEAERARVLDKLAGFAELAAGRRVLLVGRDQGHDEVFDAGAPLGAAVREALVGTAAAVLAFRGADAHGRPHFEVLDSNLESLPIGQRIRDPRRIG